MWSLNTLVTSRAAEPTTSTVVQSACLLDVHLNGCPIRLSPRRRLDDRPRQYSLDHSFHLQPAAATRQRFVYRPNGRQGSLDSKIEEIFQTPVEEKDEYEESGGEQNQMKDDGGRDDERRIQKDFKKVEDNCQTKDASLNGVVIVGGSKLCKRCGNLLDD